ncbi:MAG: hypothetical protein ACFB00_11280 [Parvularculaceae bacterium]
MNRFLTETAAPTAALFASAATLLCCALPALLITIGAGAAMASLVAFAPGLVWLSAHKTGLFVVAGALLAGAAAAKFGARRSPCPADSKAARACARTRRVGTVTLAAAVAIYAVGGFFAFFAADLLL